MSAAVAPDSPLARLRADYAARQKDRHHDIEAWPGCVLRVGLVGAEDTGGVRGAVRAMISLGDDDPDSPVPSVDDMADVIAAACRGIYYRNDDGELEQVIGEQGLPVRYDAGYGAAIGVPEITTPRGAVLVAFTEGEPPQVNARKLAAIATEIAGWLNTDGTPEDAVSGQ